MHTLHQYLSSLKQKASEQLLRCSELAKIDKHAEAFKDEIASLTKVLENAAEKDIEVVCKQVDELIKKIDAAVATGKAEALRELQNELIRLFANDQPDQSRHAIPYGSDSAELKVIHAGTKARAWDAKNLPAKTLADALGSAGKRTGVHQLVLNEADGRLQYYVANGMLDQQGPLTALNFVKELNKQIDGKGGGKPELSQGGTKDLRLKDKIVALFVASFDKVA